MIDPLSELAIRNGTDKFGYHCYTPNYHKLFLRFRDRRLKILEIGVGGYQDEDRGGQSLATWRDYFPQAEVTGIDIQKKVLDLGPRVAIRQGSQVDAEFLAALVEERGPFDLIIDDGSHRNEHVVESFRLLFPGLVPGGVYVVEDVQTSFMPRFGGSLEMKQPNSVGFFRGIIADPDATPGVAAVERFHNMVAIHKAGGEGAGLARSTASVIVPEAAVGPAASGSKGKKKKAAPPAPSAAVVIRLPAASATPADWRAALDRLPGRGLVILEGTAGPALVEDLLARFVEVDQREIRHNFPKAEIDPVATRLYGIERHPDGWVLIKAPNDYPSNFAFEIDHPQAAATCAEIERVLAAHPTEEGLVHYANLITAERGREAARGLLDQLDGMGATARVYYHLAGGLAQRDRRLERAAELFAAALTHFRDDAGFVLSLGSVLGPLGRQEEAREVVERGLAAHPRDVNLHLLMVRIAEALNLPDLSVDHAREAVQFSPPPKKPRAQAALGEALFRAGRLDEAAEVLDEALALDTPHAARAWRALSAVRQGQGDAGAARAAAEKALALRPESRDFRDWHASLAG